jgi:hypothetical protein
MDRLAPRLGLAAFTTLLLPARASAEGDHHLFKPVPREEMRELSTDRPDTTESPISVDAGHFQIEADLAVLVIDRDPGSDTTGYELFPMNLKAGLLDWMDLQLVLEPYHHVKVDAAGMSVVDSGYGATTLRLKMNLWGNDGGTTALALMPTVTFVDDGVDAGLIAPLGIELPAGFALGLMLEADLIRRAGGSRGVDILSTATVGHDLIGSLGAYVELALNTPTYGDACTLAVDGGLTLGLGDYVQLDTGVRGGAVGPLPDAELFWGFSGKL